MKTPGGHTWLSTLPKTDKECCICGLKKKHKIIDGKYTMFYVDRNGNEFLFPNVPKCKNQ